MRASPIAVSLALLVAVALARPARADRKHASVALQYLPGASASRCPGPDYLGSEVGRRLGYELFKPDAPSRLTLRIDRQGARYRASAEIRDQDGKVTSLEDQTFLDCAEAVSMMATSIAAEFTHPPEPCPTCPPTAPCPPAAPCPHAPAPPRPRLQIGFESSVAFALSPAAAVVGPAWFVGARFESFSFALEGRALFAPSADAGGIAVVPSVVTGALGGCAHYRMLFGCGRFEIGSLRFRSAADLVFQPESPIIAGFGARVGAEWAFLEHLALRGHADLMTLVVPIRLHASGESRVRWALPAVSPSLGLGLVTSF